MLQPIVADIDQYLSVDAPGRSEIIFKALQSMTRVMADYQVVGFRKERRLELMLRTDAQILNAKANDAFRYHPFQNPVKHRRTAALEVGMLLEDVRTGNLLRACSLHRRGARLLLTASLFEFRRDMTSNSAHQRKASMAARGCLH